MSGNRCSGNNLGYSQLLNRFTNRNYNKKITKYLGKVKIVWTYAYLQYAFNSK